MTETPADPRLEYILVQAQAFRADMDDIIRAAEAHDIDELCRLAEFHASTKTGYRFADFLDELEGLS